MNNDTMTVLLGVIRRHLVRHGLPTPQQLDVTSYNSQFAVFAGSGDLGRTARLLLWWADTLDDLAVHLHWAGDTNPVIITVAGRMPSGQRVSVFVAADYTPGLFPDLPANTRQTVELGMLHVWAWAEGVAA